MVGLGWAGHGKARERRRKAVAEGLWVISGLGTGLARVRHRCVGRPVAEQLRCRRYRNPLFTVCRRAPRDEPGFSGGLAPIGTCRCLKKETGTEGPVRASVPVMADTDLQSSRCSGTRRFRSQVCVIINTRPGCATPPRRRHRLPASHRAAPRRACHLTAAGRSGACPRSSHPGTAPCPARNGGTGTPG
jgi:hypothetical protein